MCCEKVVFTQKNGSRIAISRHSIDMIEEVVADNRTVITHNMYGESHEITVLETFDEVMALLYPEEKEEHEGGEMPMTGGSPY